MRKELNEVNNVLKQTEVLVEVVQAQGRQIDNLCQLNH